MPAQVKFDLVENMRELLKTNTSLILVDYRGISAEQIKDARAKLRPNGVKLSIVKNNLFKIALKEEGFPELDEVLTGTTAVVYSQGDLSLSAPAIKELDKKLGLLKIKGGVMEGSVLNAEQVVKVADLPSREVMLSMLVGAIQGPVSNLVFSTKGIINKLVYALNAVKESKGDAA